jgi:hypothetical protein
MGYKFCVLRFRLMVKRGPVVTASHARSWDPQPQQRDLTPVLHRPVEPATHFGHIEVRVLTAISYSHWVTI